MKLSFLETQPIQNQYQFTHQYYFIHQLPELTQVIIPIPVNQMKLTPDLERRINKNRLGFLYKGLPMEGRLWSLSANSIKAVYSEGGMSIIYRRRMGLRETMIPHPANNNVRLILFALDFLKTVPHRYYSAQALEFFLESFLLARDIIHVLVHQTVSLDPRGELNINVRGNIMRRLPILESR